MESLPNPRFFSVFCLSCGMFLYAEVAIFRRRRSCAERLVNPQLLHANFWLYFALSVQASRLSYSGFAASSRFFSALHNFVSLVVTFGARSLEFRMASVVKMWIYLFHSSWLLCTRRHLVERVVRHELLILKSVLDEIFDFTWWSVLFSSGNKFLLHLDWKFCKHKRKGVLFGFEPNCLFAIVFEIFMKSLNVSDLGTFLRWSDLYRESFLKFSCTYSFLNFAKRSCSFVSRFMWIVCQISMAFSQRRLRKKGTSSLLSVWSEMAGCELRKSAQIRCTSLVVPWKLASGCAVVSSWPVLCAVGDCGISDWGIYLIHLVIWIITWGVASVHAVWPLLWSVGSRGLGVSSTLGELFTERAFGVCHLEGRGLLASGTMSECWTNDLDRLDALLFSVDRSELLSLTSLTDWVHVSSCVAIGATISFILLSTPLNDSFHSINWGWRLSLTLLSDSTVTCASPFSTKCQVGVMFRSDMVIFLVDGKKTSVLLVIVKYKITRIKIGQSKYIKNSKFSSKWRIS